MINTLLNKINNNKNVFTVCMTMIILAFIAGWWQKLGTHEQVTNNISNKQFHSQDQNQATIVFPNKQFMFEYENFVYRFDTSERDVDKNRQEFNTRCLMWSADRITSNFHIVHCFKRKKKNE
jgi:Ca2+/H+ antiporter